MDVVAVCFPIIGAGAGDGKRAVNVLTANLLFSTCVFWLATMIYVLPRLPGLRPPAVLVPILLLHAFRHLGLMFLAPGAT
jgi:hypothetical protein